MREIIFESSGPRLVYSGSGRLKLFRTGSDNFAEHNDASEELARRVCQMFLEVQPITDRFRITKTEAVQFLRLPVEKDGAPEAVFGVNTPGGNWFTGSEKHPLDHSSVLYHLKTFHADVAAALAWGNFAIRVRGSDKVEALAHFHEAVLAGDVVVVPCDGNFTSPGVALVNLQELSSPELLELNRNPRKFLEMMFGR